jgi:hypothetical protein
VVEPLIQGIVVDGVRVAVAVVIVVLVRVPASVAVVVRGGAASPSDAAGGATVEGSWNAIAVVIHLTQSDVSTGGYRDVSE